jgi:hypothetical protein
VQVRQRAVENTGKISSCAGETRAKNLRLERPID